MRHLEWAIVLLLLLFPSVTVRGATWLPIRDAIQTAQDSGKLIVIHLSDGRDSNDRWMDAWADKTPVADDVVLARGTSADVVLRDVIALHPYYSKSMRLTVVITDPDGEPLFLSAGAFKNPRLLTEEVRRLNGELPSFLLSMKLRREGKTTPALIAKGEGLIGAYMLKPAEAILSDAIQLAKKEHDRTLEQVAEVSYARAILQQTLTMRAIYLLEPIIAHPANDTIAAEAWYLTAAARLVMRDKKSAADGYLRAYQLAEKPSRIAEAARRHLDMLGVAVPEEASKNAAAVHLSIPKREVMAGRIEVSASAAEAARLEFLLDDARVAEQSAPPFRATISLGNLPRIHTIKAIAYDARGARIGEDAATINDRASTLGVRITEPRGDVVESHAIVAIEPRVPAGIELQSVELFWNDEKLATMIEPPFRYELKLPSKNASGYLRAVAHASGGAIAEDAKLINVAGMSESARIDAVELYAIVQDHSGRNIEGLAASDFVVKEDGVPVSVELHSAAGDPITVGIAVDTSSSMRDAMAAVVDYAAEFVQSSLTAGDETMLIAFDDQPHVIQPLTTELQHVRSDLSALGSSGETAVWDSVIYSLQQLKAAHGKRALLLFTDGNDNASRTDIKAAIQIAHESGVPVYVVMMFSQDVNALRSRPNDLYVDVARNALEELASATGGALFRFPKRVDLPKLFAQVRDDTRGEYLLSYVSHSAKPRGALRKISVDVPSRRAVVRAMSGYDGE